MTEAERSKLLDVEIDRYVRSGYRLMARTSTTAQLVKPKTFDVAAAILGLLFLVVGLLVYLLIYASSADEAVYLSVLEDGTVQRRGNAPAGAGGAICEACGYQNRLSRALCKRCRMPLAA